MDEARRKLGYGDDHDDAGRRERRRLGYENDRNASMETASNNSLQRVGESAQSHFLKVKNKDEVIRGVKARQRSQRSRTSQKEGRRNSVLKSLMVLDIDENDDDYKPENNYQRPDGGRRYLRRGSVTKHKLDADVDGMQPAARDAPGGDESDYGSDYDSGLDEKTRETRRYLRRGSVTKYSLDDKPDKSRGIQPVDVAENDHNFATDGNRLPPPPSNDFTPDKTYTKKQVSARRLSMPIQSPTRPVSTTPRRSSSVTATLPIPPNLDNYSRNLEHTGRQSRTVPLPGDDNWSGNLDDSGHTISSKSKQFRQKNKKALDAAARATTAGFKRATKPLRKLSKSGKKKDSAETSPKKSSRSTSSKNRRHILETQNTLDPEEDSMASSATATTRSNSSMSRKDSESDLDDSDCEFASEEVVKQPIFAERKTKKRPPRLPPTGNLPANDKKPPRPSLKSTPSLRKGLQTIDYERDSRSTSTTMSNSSGNDDTSVSSSASLKTKPCLKKPNRKPPVTSKVVRFGTIIISEFPIILGDNPAVTAGAPVTIDWNPQDENMYSVTAYEQCKPKRRRRRKLLISVSNRAILLLAAGYSIDEIADASIQVQQIKSGRQESLQNQNWDRVNLLVEHGVGMVQTTNSTVTGAVTGAVTGVTGMVQSTGKKLKSLVVKPVQQTETARMA